MYWIHVKVDQVNGKKTKVLNKINLYGLAKCTVTVQEQISVS